MARMFPRKLPPDVETNPLRATEIKVYQRLQHQLSDEWVVFYSRPWLGLTPTGDEVEGECDFVIAHADHGLLCVEVKGGSVMWNPQTDRWTSQDRHGIVHNIKDPVAQARSSKHQILEKLREFPDFSRRRVRARHGVILPDCTAPEHPMGPDRPRFIFCFEREFGRNLSGWVLGRFGQAEEYQGSEEPLGQDGVDTLEALLAKPLNFRVPLGSQVRHEDEQLAYLTQQQYHMLEAIGSIVRVAIQGGAGTGKTVLAEWHARQLAASGLRTLLVCYNEALAARLAARCQDIAEVQVCTFHSLCHRILASAGKAIAAAEDDSDRFFERVLPEAALEACQRPEVRRFDAIIVDEGQDFRSLWWAVLDQLLSGDGPGFLRVFVDGNQRVYSDVGGIPRTVQLTLMHLSWNLRNTAEIHKAAYQYYSGRKVDCKGPAGEAPARVIVRADSSHRETMDELLGQLIEREALAAEEIAVLVSGTEWIPRLAPEGVLGGVPVQDASLERPGYLTVDTVRRFKGLEARVLVLLVDEAVVAGEELCYVALSRGRTRVFLVGFAGDLERVEFSR